VKTTCLASSSWVNCLRRSAPVEGEVGMEE
jgi:hypothetical protein